MRKLCDVDEVKKCLDEVTGDDSEYAKGLLEWAIGKRTIDEADIRADERKKVLDELIDALYENLYTFVDNDRWTSDGSLMWKTDEVRQVIEKMKGE